MNNKNHIILTHFIPLIAQKMKFSNKDFSSKCKQIRWKLRIWSHLLEKSLMENFIFCAATGLFHAAVNFGKPEILCFQRESKETSGTK